MPMTLRIAHYIPSTHWDREWYEPFQGFRMRLVSMLDEVIGTLHRDPGYAGFFTDGQAILLQDYLEVRRDKAAVVRKLLQDKRLVTGPWFCLPDEWLVSGESLVRNLLFGMELSREFGGEPSRAGVVVDQFGHTGQLPQIFAQLGLVAAFVWRGTHELDLHGHFLWTAPDGTTLPTHRFGRHGYCNLAIAVREGDRNDRPQSVDGLVERLVEYTRAEARRTAVPPILLYDGGDHLEIEPLITQVIRRANEQLAGADIRIVHSSMDAYLSDLLPHAGAIRKTAHGELRESGREHGDIDHQWVIPGVLSSRIHLKQRNAACEDELCLWAEPFSAFAAVGDAAFPDPADYLRLAWKHLLENHPHDSICGCSPDPIHQDMIYRFDQSLGISRRLSDAALRALVIRAQPHRDRPAARLALGIFNPTARPIDEPIDLDVPLPTDWPKMFREFFGFEEKFAFKLYDDAGREVPYQLVSHARDRAGFRRNRYKFPAEDRRHVVGVTARLSLPPGGYTTLTVEPVDGYPRYLGSMMPSHHVIENQRLRVTVAADGTVDLLHKPTNRTYTRLLTFEDCADIGDGWYHGVAVNDQVFLSIAAPAQVAVVHDGIGKATLRIVVEMRVPRAFDFRAMTRSPELAPLHIETDLTLRDGCDRLECRTRVENTVLDHRLRVLLPTHLAADEYWADSAFDAVRRPVALVPDNAARRELDIETRPQQTWTAVTDGTAGLAVVSRGLPESAVRDRADRAIALTLLRSFRKAVLSNDNFGGQIQGEHAFRFDLVPFAGPVPAADLSWLGQRVTNPPRAVSLRVEDIPTSPVPPAARRHAFMRVEGPVVVTSCRRTGVGVEVRLFNPGGGPCAAAIEPGWAWSAVRGIRLDGSPDPAIDPRRAGDTVTLAVPAKRIVTVQFSS